MPMWLVQIKDAVCLVLGAAIAVSMRHHFNADPETTQMSLTMGMFAIAFGAMGAYYRLPRQWMRIALAGISLAIGFSYLSAILALEHVTENGHETLMLFFLMFVLSMFPVSYVMMGWNREEETLS